MLDADIRLRKSLLLSDAPEAGGAMSGDDVISGALDNIGVVIADLDRTTGYVFLRKVFPYVDTPDTDIYYKTTCIIDAVPGDPNVSGLLTSGTWFETRSGIQDRISRYLAPGVKWPGRLLETQLTGQRAIQMLLKTTDPLPAVGTTLYLVQDEGTETAVDQYVRVADVTTIERSFTVVESNQQVTFTGVIAVVEITEPLRVDFIGLPPGRLDSEPSRAKVRETVVADATLYYGTSPLAVAGSVADLHVTAESIMSHLVPAAQAETPLVDLDAAGEAAPIIAAGGSVTFSTSASIGPGLGLHLGNPCAPGSLTITTAGGAQITDVRGALRYQGAEIGSIDYPRGLLAFAPSAPSFGGSKSIAFTPAAVPSVPNQSASLAVDQATRGYTYTMTLQPPPAKGTLRVSYLAAGRWYDLRDSGDGAILGADPAYGSGTLSTTTNTAVVTLGALPDIGSEIIFQWGSGYQFAAPA